MTMLFVAQCFVGSVALISLGYLLSRAISLGYYRSRREYEEGRRKLNG